MSAFSDANNRVFQGTKGELNKTNCGSLVKTAGDPGVLSVTGFECQSDEQPVFCLLNSFQQSFAF